MLRPYINTTEVKLDDSKLPKVGFANFVRYLSDPRNVFGSTDVTEHWNEMYRMCHPCLINYTYIGEFDSLAQDSSFILKDLEYMVDLPKATNPTNTSNAAVWKSYLSLLSNSELAAMKKRYEIDARLFGYNI